MALGGLQIRVCQATKHDPIMRAIRDPAFPSYLALRLAKVHVLPRPMYLLRALPMRVTAEQCSTPHCAPPSPIA